MTEISGSLKLVTGSPAAVSQVWLRAPNGRVQGSEYVTEAPDTVPVTGGAVSFDALPGAMVMTLISHGSPTHTVKLLVPDKTSATLAECIEAAELATDGTRSALERLALEVQAELGQVPSLVSDALAQDSTIIDAVRQASVIREDTTVGTRVFAGDTMIYGDTGWRKIDGSGGEYLQEGEYLVRREGRRLWVILSGVVFRERNNNSSLGRLPRLFRGTPFSTRFPVYAGIENTPTLSGNVSGLGYVNIYGTKTDTPVSGYICLATDEAWPTSLPGTPA